MRRDEKVWKLIAEISKAILLRLIVDENGLLRREGGLVAMVETMLSAYGIKWKRVNFHRRM